MKMTRLLLVLSALALSGCDFISISDSNQTTSPATGNQTTQNTQNSQNNAGNTGENQQNTSTNTGTNTGSNTGSNTGTNTGSNTGNNTGSNTGTNTGSTVNVNNKIDPKDVIPENDPYSLSDKTKFTWHDGREPDYSPDWQFYYGTSLNPNGCLWTNPNEKSEYSGVELKENSFIVSPVFNSWLKVEINFSFWFNSHTSDKYKAANNRAQFILEAYTNDGNLISTQEINIERSDVPSNNTPKNFRQYIREETMSFFILRFNNFIPNGNSGYTAVLCDASLQGWPYNS